MNAMAKLTHDDVYRIKNLVAKGYFQREVAVMFDITQPHVSAICSGRKWRDMQ